jgi:hypothetical protein
MKKERGCGRCGRNAALRWYRCCTRHVVILGVKDERVFCAVCVGILHPGENLVEKAEAREAERRRVGDK